MNSEHELEHMQPEQVEQVARQIQRRLRGGPTKAERIGDVVAISPGEAHETIDLLNAGIRSHQRIAVWVDPIDRAFKVKIGNGTWSPPMGEPT